MKKKLIPFITMLLFIACNQNETNKTVDLTKMLTLEHTAVFILPTQLYISAFILLTMQ